MMLNEKIFQIYKLLCENRNKDYILNDILEDFGISDNSDFNEVAKKLKSTDHFNIISAPKGKLLIRAKLEAVDYFNSISIRNEKKEREEQIKDFQLQDLKNKVASFEEQKDFWTTSTNRNRNHIKALWITIGINIIGLILNFIYFLYR